MVEPMTSGLAGFGRKDGVNTYISSPCSGSSSLSGDNHIFSVSDGDSLFQDPEGANFRPRSGASIDSSAAAVIGFDPKCIKREASNPAPGYTDFWTHAPDLEYIRSIGGIKQCFHN